MNDLRDELSDFARHIDVPTSSASDAMARARRRSQLTAVTRVGAAVLLVGAGVVGVQQLSGPGLQGDPIDAPNDVADSAAPVTGPDGLTVPPATGPGDPATDSADPTGDGLLANAPQSRPAEYMDLDYSWVAYPVDAPEAVALRFDPDAQYAVSSAEGSDGLASAVYSRTDDGWEQIEKLNTARYQLVGDTVYTIEEDSGHSLRAFDITTRTWSDVAPPEGASPTLPEGSSLSVDSAVAFSATGDTLVALFSAYYQLSGETQNAIGSSEVSVDLNAEGGKQVVLTDMDCVQRLEEAGGSVPGTTIYEEPPGTYVAGTTPSDGTYPGFDRHTECERRVGAADIGLTDEELALAYTWTQTIWTLRDGTWKQVALPDDGWNDVVLNDGGIVTMLYEAQQLGVVPSSKVFAVNEDASLRPMYGGTTFTDDITPMSAEQYDGPVERAVTSSGSYVLSQDTTSDDWSATDLNALGDRTGWGDYEAIPGPAVGTPNGGVLVLGNVVTDVPTETTELTSGDYTIRFEPGISGSTTVINNATGENVDDFSISTESGKVELLLPTSPNGDEATAATFDTDWADVPGLNLGSKQVVFASPDGVRFGAIDSDTLTGLISDPPNQTLRLYKIDDNDGRIVLTGSFDDPFEIGQTFVFVGTPN